MNYHYDENLKKKKKYQLIYNNEKGINRIVVDCDKICEVFDWMYVNTAGKYLYRFSLKMDGKVLE